jgi:hypothetical protein
LNQISLELIDMDSVSVAGENTAALPRRSATVRSKLANGSKLLPLTDGRSATARRFRDLYEDICADLGGMDLLSEGQKQLARRAAMLSAEAERLEALAARNERPSRENWKEDLANKFDVITYGVICDRLGRLFDRLGLERRARPVSNPVLEYFHCEEDVAVL